MERWRPPPTASRSRTDSPTREPRRGGSLALEQRSGLEHLRLAGRGEHGVLEVHRVQRLRDHLGDHAAHVALVVGGYRVPGGPGTRGLA